MITEKKIDLYKYFNLQRPEGAKGYLNSYILERSQEYSANRMRPAMIVFTGGGYWMRSDREKEPIALSYLAKGFNAFTVEYTVGSESDNAHMPVMLIEACMAVAFVRENADKYKAYVFLVEDTLKYEVFKKTECGKKEFDKVLAKIKNIKKERMIKNENL